MTVRLTSPRRARLAAVGAGALALVLTACASSSESQPDAEPSTAPSATGITAETVESSFDTLDQIAEDVMAETGVPGIAIAVVYDDETVYQKGFGVRRSDSDEPVEPETVFQIASLSKPVSATIMAGMAGDGVFAWADPIVGYAPDFQLSNPYVTENVSFADLFAHRSGIPGGPAGNDLEAVGFDRATILERMRYVPLEPFRITYSYSNFGMTMAGEAAARAAGTSWEQASQEVLFEPAGMTSSSMSYADFISRDNRAALHIQRDGEWVPAFERMPDAQAPAGGMSSNVVDLARWMRLSLAEGNLDGNQIIDSETLDQTHTPQILKRPPSPTIGSAADFYGLGWDILTDETGTIRWTHSGAFSTGAATAASLIPNENTGIVVLSNGAPIGVPEAIADAYLQYLQTGDADTEGNLELWSERFAGLYGEPELDLASPPANPLPARAESAYVGTYRNPYVGDVVIRTGDAGLEMVVGPENRVFPLTHWDADTFYYFDAPELPDFPSTVTFDVNDGSTASTVTISAFNQARQGTLERVPTDSSVPGQQ